MTLCSKAGNAVELQVIIFMASDFVSYKHDKMLESFVRGNFHLDITQFSSPLSFQLHFIQCPFPNQIQFALEKLNPKNA